MMPGMDDPTPDPADTPHIPVTPDTADMTEEQLAEHTLQTKLAEYHAAIEAEYAASQVKGAETNIQEKVQELYKNHAVRSATDIVWLSQHSTSDSVRLSALKFIQTEAFKLAIADNDPYKQLLEQLTKKPTPESQDITNT